MVHKSLVAHTAPFGIHYTYFRNPSWLPKDMFCNPSYAAHQVAVSYDAASELRRVMPNPLEKNRQLKPSNAPLLHYHGETGGAYTALNHNSNKGGVGLYHVASPELAPELA